MNQGILDAFVTAVIAASDYEEMDRIYLKNRVMSRVSCSVCRWKRARRSWKASTAWKPSGAPPMDSL